MSKYTRLRPKAVSYPVNERIGDLNGLPFDSEAIANVIEGMYKA